MGLKNINIYSFTLLKEFDTNKDGIIDSKDSHNLALWIDSNKDGITNKDELIYLKDINSPIKQIELNPLDTLLSGYDKNHDLKIDNKDAIFNYIYFKQNLDNSINLYIYGDEKVKEYLNDYKNNLTIKTDKGIKEVKSVNFYKDLDELNLTIKKEYELKDVDKSYTIYVNNADNVIKAGNKDDIIYTFNGDDTVYAGDGDDILIGGDGKDTLCGEKGYDTYLADKDDTIIDSDGKGRVYLDNVLLKDAIFIGTDSNNNKIYKNTLHTYTLDEKTKTLIVNNSLKIKDYSNGNLDINLLSQKEGYDTVIVIDRTGSMQNNINKVKKESTKLINQLLNSEYGDKNSRVAIVTYTGNDIRVHTTFTNNKEVALNAINSIPSTSSGTAYVGKTLKTILNGSVGDFRINNNNRVYLFGDAYEDNSSNLNDAVKLANEKGVEVYSISIGRNIAEFKALANDTNGRNLYAKNADEVAKVLFEAMLDGSNKNDLIEADDSPNTIYAKNGNDIIYAKGGDDTIYAGSGDDFINAGKGNDEIHTGSGNDILFFEKGDGKDKIYYESGSKIIQFGKSVTKNDISFYLDNKTFKLSYSNSDEISIDIKSLNASLRIELSSGEFLELKDIYTIVQNLAKYAIRNKISLSNEIIKRNETLKSMIINSFKEGSVSKINSEILPDNHSKENAEESLNLDELKTNNSIYIDDKVLLSRANFKEIILRSGYTGIKTGGTSAIVSANGGEMSFENAWYRSDNTDTIYDEESNSYISGSGTVRGLDDAMKDNDTLKNSVDEYKNSLDLAFDDLNSNMDNILKNWALNDDFMSNISSTPPIVLDLNQNGITSTKLENSDAYFDYQNNGRRYKTSWIEKEDSLLGIDINGDGVINNAYELFGTFSKLKNGSYAKDGYEALKEFDTNGDGVIDQNDENFEKLVAWQDKNGDGKSEKDEVKSLKDLGISSISLNISDEIKEENGNKITASSTFIKDDKEYVMRDIWFNVSSKQSIAVSDLSDSDEKKISVVEAFRGAKLTTFQRSNPYEILKALKEYENIKYSTISKIISKELFGKEMPTCHIMYQALNQKLNRIIANESNPNEIALSINLLAASLKRDYNFAIHKVGKNTLSNPIIKKLLEKTGIKFSFNENGEIEGVIGKNYFGTKDSDNFNFSKNSEGVIVNSKSGNDLIIGSSYNDELNGGLGNDIIYAGDGIDVLRGAQGDDLLIGGDKSTIYEYYLGDGHDTIVDEGGRDILAFSYLDIENLSIEKDGNNMKILVENPYKKDKIIGSITIIDGFTSGKIEEYYFKDRAYSFDEMFKTVSANSTYYFNSGDGIVSIDDKGGVDKLIFGKGVNFKNIIVIKKENDLEIALNLPNRNYDELLDKLRIKNFFTQTGRIESFIFDNGVILNHEEILSNLKEIKDDKFIMGDDNDNVLNGTDNANIINGKKGNDILNGGFGDDNYIYEKDSGKDIINDTGGNDKLVFGLGITRKDLISKEVGGDLVIALKEEGVSFDELKNSITIKNWKNKDNKIESVMYDNGIVYNIDTLLNTAPTLLSKSSTYTLKNTDTVTGNIGAGDIDGDTLSYKVISNLNNSTINIDKEGNFIYKTGKTVKDTILVEVSDGALSITKELNFNNLGYVIDTNDNITIEDNKLISNSLEFNADIKDVDFLKDKDNLVIKSPSSSLTLKDYFINDKHQIPVINFKDTSLDINSPLYPTKKWWQINPSIKLDNKGVIISYEDNAVLKASSKDDTIISLNSMPI